MGDFKLSSNGKNNNEFSLGATLGNFSGEISANLDAAADYVNESINAVTQFFGNLIDEIINPEKHYDNN